MRLKLISCEMFKREIRAVAAHSHNLVDIEFLPRSLHQLTARETRLGLQNLLGRIQRSQFHAVLLVSGTCQQSLGGLQAPTIPLVLPRAKDCLSLLMERPQEALHRAARPVSSRPPQLEPNSFMRSIPRGDDREGAQLDYSSNRCGANVFNASRRGALDSLRAWRDPARHEPVLDHRRLRHPPKRILCRKDRSARTVSPSKAWPMRPTVSLLQLLVDGYWSYDDFLVVPAGYQVVVQAGNISAKEIHV